MTTSFPLLFETLDRGPLHLRSRLMMTVHGPRLPQRRYLPYLEARSREVAMVGLHAAYGMGQFPPGPGVFSAADHPDPDAVMPHPLTEEGRAYCETFVPVLAEQAEAIRRGGALCVGQLHHAGAADAGDSLGSVAGPSAVTDEFRRRQPHVLGLGEIADLIQVYAEAAGRIVRAGCDLLEIHAGHGYLLQQFLSPITNRRQDRYGGDLEQRMRLLLEVVDAVAGELDGALPFGVRMAGSEKAEGGLTNADMCTVGATLAARGAAYLSVSNGTYTGLRRGLGLAYVAPSYVDEGPAAPDAAAIRATSGLPVVVTGRIVDPATAERILADGSADVIGVTWALIADPDLFTKARHGGTGDIVPCIACNECHTGLAVRCTVNPAAGREHELAVRPTDSARHVVVVGAGPAGLQCAAVAAERGHRVTLIERDGEPGGALRLLSLDPGRPQFAQWLAGLVHRVEQAGVAVRLGVEATVGAVVDLDPDDVVVATGADEMLPAGPAPAAGDGPGTGAEGAGPVVLSGLAVLAGLATVPDGHVVVVGGLEAHLAPLVVAEAAARSGSPVTLLTELLAEGENVEPATRYELVRRLSLHGVTVRRLAALQAIEPVGVVVRDVLTGQIDRLAPVSAVVMAGERRARTQLADELLDAGLRAGVHLIGDCQAPRRLLHATSEGARQAVAL